VIDRNPLSDAAQNSLIGDLDPSGGHSLAVDEQPEQCTIAAAEVEHTRALADQRSHHFEIGSFPWKRTYRRIRRRWTVGCWRQGHLATATLNSVKRVSEEARYKLCLDAIFEQERVVAVTCFDLVVRDVGADGLERANHLL
jgi:hypothetical protein